MELPEINEIKQIRDRMGLSLRKFAKECDLSASWINQVESGAIPDPSYLKMKKIFDMYENKKHVKQQTAEELCIPRKEFRKPTDSKLKKYMISFKIGDLITDVNKTMQTHGISQIPVLKKNHCIGMITIQMVMNLSKDADLSKIKIHPDMFTDEVPPIEVPVQTPLNTLRRVLNFSEYILVTKEGIIYGILVREDLVKQLKKN